MNPTLEAAITRYSDRARAVNEGHSEFTRGEKIRAGLSGLPATLDELEPVLKAFVVDAITTWLTEAAEDDGPFGPFGAMLDLSVQSIVLGYYLGHEHATKPDDE